MARRKANDLENQMSLMDMMASESPEYTEEGPEELMDPGEDTGDSEGQTDKPFKLVANKTTKAKASISTQALSVVKAVYADTVETNWEELFDGFDRLYAITFSSGIEFVNKVINKFSYAEVVFGCEKIIANDIAAIMSVQIDSVQRLAKSKSAGNLANRLDDGSLQLYVSRDTKSHEKIFILESADHKRVRVITGSANMSASAFCGIQRENIVCFDDEAAFSHYKVLFETFKETCSDNVSYKAVVSTMNQEDYLKENIKEVPVFQSIEKQKIVFAKKKTGLNKKYGALSVLNQIIPALTKELSSLFPKHFFATNGKSTYDYRAAHGVSKDHWLDAYCIACSVLADDVCDNNINSHVPYELKQFRRHDRRALHKENMSRVYTLNGKSVATNRHKATEQTTDSLEEFRQRQPNDVCKLKVKEHHPEYRNPKRNFPGCVFLVGKHTHVMQGTSGSHNGKADGYYDTNGNSYSSGECKFVAKNGGIVFA